MTKYKCTYPNNNTKQCTIGTSLWCAQEYKHNLKTKESCKYWKPIHEPKRKTWDNTFMDMAHLVTQRSTCIRRAVGAVLVKDNHVISTGYNGAPKKASHCSVTGCLRETLSIPSGERAELCRGIHAEQNVIIQCATSGASCEGATLYTTTYPCSICAKMIINAQIVKVIYVGDYPDKKAKEIFENIDVIQYKE